MKPTARVLAAVIAASAALSGCSAALPPTGGLTPTRGAGPAAGAAQRGKVRVAFAGGLGQGYKTLATRADVARVKLALTSHPGGKVQVRELGPKELAKAMVYVDFDAVAAGKATLAVDAFDAQGRAIGKGENGTAVAAGKTSTLHVAVKLDPAVGTGDVDAVFTFVDTYTPAPPRRDGVVAFRRAARDGDGWLSLGEYTQGWPHAWGVVAYPMPVPMIAPAEPGTPPDQAMIAPAIAPAPGVAVGEPAPGGWACATVAFGQAPDAATIAYPCQPPVDPARQDFRRRDADRDGRLGLAEFLGQAPLSWADARFIDLDLDSDDRLAYGEWVGGEGFPRPMPMDAPATKPAPNWRYERFKALDTNADGWLDRAEFAASLGDVVAFRPGI